MAGDDRPTDTAPAAIRVLVIDDAEADFQLIKRRLERVDFPKFEVLWANTFDAGIQGVESGQFDAFLVDLHLGNENGIELVRTARQMDCDAPLILLTGSASRLTDLESMRAGATDFIDKNAAPSGLIERVVRYGVERHRAQRQLRWLTRHDPLTGLLNRSAIREFVGAAMARARRNNGVIGLLYVNVIGFRHINAEVGASAGDELLRAIAERLMRTKRPQDQVARLGGDEFMVLLDELPDADEAGDVARQMAASLAQPFRVGEQRLSVSAPIGAVLFPADGDDLETLVLNADTAMNRARADAMAVSFWSRAQQMRFQSAQQLLLSLDGALERGDFVLHFQPVFRAEDGRLIGFESLLRWQHLDHGLVTPREFMHILERSDKVHDIGEWVLDNTCKLLQRCRRETGVTLRATVNLTARELLHIGLPARMDTMLRRYELPGRMLQVDIPELAIATRLVAVEPAVADLRQIGIRVALDGFGRSGATLDVLQALRLDAVKLGESLVRGIGADRQQASVLAAVVEMWRALGAEIWADAVEVRGDLRELQRMRCDFVQGYLFGGPGHEDRIVELAFTEAEAAGRPVPRRKTSGTISVNKTERESAFRTEK